MAIVTWCIVLSSGLCGAIVDVREHRLPNLLTFPLFFTGLVWNIALEGAGGLAHAGLGALVAALPYLILFGAGCGGAGDAKMMAALGAWLAWPNSVILLLAVAVTGGVLGLAFTFWRGKGAATLGLLGRMALWLLSRLPGGGVWRAGAGVWPTTARMIHLPYGVAIFMGSLLAAVGVWLWH